MTRTSDLLDKWEEPKEVSLWGNAIHPPISPAWEYYINLNIHPNDMVILFRVIFPAIVEIDDCVLLKMNADGHSKKNLVKFRKQAASSQVFERQFNTLKIYDLFSHREVEHESSFEQAATLLKQSWEITLSNLFPDRVFEVSLSNTDRDYGPTLTFHKEL